MVKEENELFCVLQTFKMKIIFRFGKTKLHVCWLSGVIVSERKKGLSKGSGNEECFSSVDCSSNCNGYYYL